MPRPQIEVFDPNRHPPALLGGFRNQEESLTRYLKRYARQNARKYRINQTFLAVDRSGAEPRLAGYFTLAFCSGTAAPAKDSLPGHRRLPGYPIAGILLAQLAVDERVQGQGLGTYLVDEALRKTLGIVEKGGVPVRLFVTDAINDAAVAFYEKYGLTRISDAMPARMICDLKPYIDDLSGAL
jgi:ribosomal protein S18 acetylase RimI-like enzyme